MADLPVHTDADRERGVGAYDVGIEVQFPLARSKKAPLEKNEPLVPPHTKYRPALFVQPVAPILFASIRAEAAGTADQPLPTV